jgi:hypothetical protein
MVKEEPKTRKMIVSITDRVEVEMQGHQQEPYNDEEAEVQSGQVSVAQTGEQVRMPVHNEG